MKIILLLTALGFPLAASAQTDIEIVNALLGQPYAQANAILAKMGVVYHYHYKDTKNAAGEDPRPKVYSIQNNEKITKVWILHYDKAVIVDEIVINFRHDDMRQVDDSQRLATVASEFHVGTYSTDLVFKKKK